MLGIVLISHGPLAKGMAETAEMFFGTNIPQFTFECLGADQSPEDFYLLIEKAIERVDDGNGVICLTDLFGGTPSNQAGLYKDKAVIITGMNLGMLLELLGQRMNGIDLDKVIYAGKEGIKNLSEEAAEENDFFGE